MSPTSWPRTRARWSRSWPRASAGQAKLDRNYLRRSWDAAAAYNAFISRCTCFSRAFNRRSFDLTGLHYYKNRYFDSGLGRFVGRDPIGYKDLNNLYEYVGGRVTAWLDLIGTLSVNLVGDVKKANGNADNEWSYLFQVQYDGGKEGASKIILAKVENKATWLTRDCEQHYDSWTYYEWFRLGADGKTPTADKQPILAKDGKTMRSGSIDWWGNDPGIPVCWAIEDSTVTYGFAKGVTDKVSVFGLTNPDSWTSSGGPISSVGTQTEDLLTTKNVEFEGETKTWGFHYVYSSGESCCCDDLEYSILSARDKVLLKDVGDKKGWQQPK